MNDLRTAAGEEIQKPLLEPGCVTPPSSYGPEVFSSMPPEIPDPTPAAEPDMVDETKEVVAEEETPVSTPESACVIDGSKLILRIASANKPFQVDHGVKILFSSGPLKRIERTLLFNTYMVEHPNTTVVIDAGGNGYRFIPLFPCANNGVIYTRDGSFHVVLCGSGVLQRSRVSAPSLPTRVVNKFVSQANFKLREGMKSDKPSDVLFPWSTLGVHSGEGGVIFVRTDESVFEHEIVTDMRSEIHEGRPIAWTGNVTFASTGGWFCFKRLNQVLGSGRLWLDNGKPANNPNVVIT